MTRQPVRFRVQWQNDHFGPLTVSEVAAFDNFSMVDSGISENQYDCPA
jgi:hypothetical protein